MAEHTHNTYKIHIGYLGPHGSDKGYFQSFRRLLPADVQVTVVGLDIPSRYELAGKTDQVIQCAADVVRRHRVHGLIIPGAPLTILNPDLEERVAETIAIPSVTAIASVTTALEALDAKKLIVMTPFDEPMNVRLTNRLRQAGFSILACPQYEDPSTGAGEKIGPEELFVRVEKTFAAAPAADAIYFQSAALDPIPIIQRIETRLRIPVVASNPAMLWNLLSVLDHKYSIMGYGRLLESWPAIH
jgi:maleate cis-trans isomerase